MKAIVLLALVILSGCQVKFLVKDKENYGTVKKESPVKNPLLKMQSPSVEKENIIEKPVLSPIYFDFDKSNLSPEAQLVIVRIVKYFLDTKCTIIISGHCDERGSIVYNNALGQRRADAAKDYLTQNGVPIEKIETRSFGKQKPFIKKCWDEGCHSQNRRDEFEIKN